MIKKQSNVNTEEAANRLYLKDIDKMSESELQEYYLYLCNSLGLNPATKPFQLIIFKSREGSKKTLYTTKDATEQLRTIKGVSIVDLTQTIDKDLCITKCKVQDSTGRYDIATGVTSLVKEEWGNGRRTGKLLPLQSEDRANAIMKSETKAKRRATLSICGLGMLDESELDTIGKYETKDISPIQTTINQPTAPIVKNDDKNFTVDDVLNTNDINYVELYSDITNAKTIEQLKKIWDNNPLLHTDKVFVKLLTETKLKLKTELVKALGDVEEVKK